METIPQTNKPKTLYWEHHAICRDFSPKTWLHKNTKTQYDQYGFDVNGYHQLTSTIYDPEGYDVDGYDVDGYTRRGLDRFFNQKP